MRLKHANLLRSHFRSFHLNLENMHIDLNFRTLEVFALTIYIRVLVEIGSPPNFISLHLLENNFCCRSVVGIMDILLHNLLICCPKFDEIINKNLIVMWQIDMEKVSFETVS